MHLSGDENGSLLIDCGASSLIAMKREGVDPGDVSVVLLSHLHGDHFGGVPFLILDAQFSRRTRPLLIAGPPGVRGRVEAAMEVLFPGSSSTPRKFDVEFIELAHRQAARVGPAEVTAFPVVHASGAPPFALRVEYGGRVIAYSGDTEWTESLVDAARGADVFVCEAYTFDRPVKFHLDYKTVEAHAERLGTRRIILTHMGRDMLAREGEVRFERAHDGLVVRV
jgi:ribonuclease BN (tRNA processing enzyme)